MKTIAQQLGVKEFPFEIKNKKGEEIYYENSNGYWVRKEFDSNGRMTYFENSDGVTIDERPKVELTMQEIADKFGIKVEQLKIKK